MKRLLSFRELGTSHTVKIPTCISRIPHIYGYYLFLGTYTASPATSTTIILDFIVLHNLHAGNRYNNKYSSHIGKKVV